MVVSDEINHPEHYQNARAECIDIIEDLGLDYHTASVLKYLWRHKQKGEPLKDLKKAKWFLERKINLLESE